MYSSIIIVKLQFFFFFFFKFASFILWSKSIPAIEFVPKCVIPKGLIPKFYFFFYREGMVSGLNCFGKFAVRFFFFGLVLRHINPCRLTQNPFLSK